MHAAIAVEDLTHEYFWRQLMRSLVDGVPDAVEPQRAHRSGRARRGDHAARRRRRSELRRAQRRDGRRARLASRRQHHGRADAVERRAQRRVRRDGAGRRRRVSTRRASRRRAPASRSARRPRTCAPRRAMPSISTPRCTPRRCGASPRRPAASTTTPPACRGCPEDLRYTGRGVTTVEERDLWHLPIVLLAARRPDVRGVGLSPRGGAVVSRQSMTSTRRDCDLRVSVAHATAGSSGASSAS